MPKLDPKQWRPLFDAIYEMNTARDHADFVTGTLAALNRLISADLCHVHVIDRATGRILHQTHPANPFRPDEIAYYVAHPREHPLLAHFDRTGDKHARRLSDVAKLAQFRRTDFYRHCLRRLDIRRSLVLPIAINATTIAALVFERQGSRRDFTKRHCALLDAFAPHFRLAWRNHADPWREHAEPKPSVRERLRQLGLTPREADVLYWMIEGKQNREIATILGRSLETIHQHVASVVRKLGQENRHAATVYVLRRLARV
jgi:DNA-binding CsgD family transcriptional regulator